MKAVYISEPGGPEVLEIRDVPAPVPGPGEVLIDVVAAGLNRADVQQRRGFYPPPPGASDIPGLEVSGRIAAFGPEVSKPFSVGDKVVALLSGGGYAQQVAVPAEQVLRLPDGVDLVTAASLPEVAATVYSNLIMTAQLQAGETVLIHGATGGIGTMAIQLAKAYGATVATTAGTAEKVGTAKAFLGADIAINYAEEDFAESLKAQNGGKGADVILDVVGAKYLQQNVEALADYGRLVVIGLQGGVKGELNLGQLVSKRAAIIGTALRPRPVAEKGVIMNAVRESVWPMLADGRIKPLVAKSFPLEQVREAHEYFDSGEHMGKVLLLL
ncbi:quinone oxidoreductase PIG3 [Arthrobacter sp. Hiyo8]|jgi:NADPH2:quinone reductase|uniref:NADPH2:quinone reductase n=1 Tax=Arthrobacter bambusae TaxID=1338426 RepID=A0AAW8DKN7_9MICC|nr:MULTISPECIES: NAD(P)H-quinone oxidoreductase [Arthrobacter]BAS14340.1 quinone oxidoreductase PIG3 [Arthrobacter sp. Hiyo8]MDP9906279.1 NADPH2:quinone reductase [Arthrobacter bambusae]MDQ0130488.1 NADPH2:quinone reductase [Arthrobacter bambusae]MDQ0182163.1 NADPH2:quinone reductase [Arthrobacter bambusae]GAP59211.1 quinone oxidoreductase PIG3 [Arthrobacter sp. Hiyo1]